MDDSFQSPDWIQNWQLKFTISIVNKHFQTSVPVQSWAFVVTFTFEHGMNAKFHSDEDKYFLPRSP